MRILKHLRLITFLFIGSIKLYGMNFQDFPLFATELNTNVTNKLNRFFEVNKKYIELNKMRIQEIDNKLSEFRFLIK